MPNNLNTIRRFVEAVAVMKAESIGLPRLEQRKHPLQVTIMIPGEEHKLTDRSEALDEPRRFRGCDMVVDEIANDQEMPRPIFH